MNEGWFSSLEDRASGIVQKIENRLIDNTRIRRYVGGTLGSIGRLLVFAGFSFIILYPLLYMLSIGFRHMDDMADPMVIWIPKTLTLENIKDAFKLLDYPTAALNSVTLGVGSSFLQIISCAMVGYGFARFKFKGKNILFALVLFTIIVPPQVVYAPTYLSYKSFDFFGLGQITTPFTGEPITINILNTAASLYLPAALGVGIRSGLFIYIFRQFYRGLPHELEDAAYIDGCGFFKTFFKVIIPNASTALLTVFLFSIVWYWNDYYYIAMYFSSTKTISMALSLLPDALATNKDTGVLSGDPYLVGTRLQAGALLAILPLLVLYIFLQKHFTQGFERTGLTG